MPSHSVPDFLGAIVERARAADGQPPFSDQALVDLRSGTKTALTIGHDALAIVSTPGSDPAEAELVVDPDARGAGLGTELLESIIETFSAELLIWAHGDHPAARKLAERFGLEPVRRLLQLRLDLSAGVPLRPAAALRLPAAAGLLRDQDCLAQGPEATAPLQPAAGLLGDQDGLAQGPAVSSFRVGVDDAEWLRVNALAFAFHPEQGSVSRADLDELFRESWFDAEDLLLIRDGDRIAGYCWLKIDDGIGEFYVVGVDPEHQRMGLGRALMAAGFARLVERGIRTAALYVESDNAPAVALYRDLGFSDHAVDIQYRLNR